MIDFHCHILPGIDDGSRDVSESLQLMKEEDRQGVRVVVFTPHFYAHRDSVEHFLSGRQNSFQRLQGAMNGQKLIPSAYMGAEVYYFTGIGRAEMVAHLCIQGTDMLLLEMPFCQWKREMLADITLLVHKRKFTVVLAHIERYFAFQKDRNIMEQIFALPLILQINAGSLLAGAGLVDFAGKKKRRICLGLLEEGRDILLGSDAHNMKMRPPNIKAGRLVIADKIGTDRLDEIDSLGERMFGNGRR